VIRPLTWQQQAHVLMNSNAMRMFLGMSGYRFPYFRNVFGGLSSITFLVLWRHGAFIDDCDCWRSL